MEPNPQSIDVKPDVCPRKKKDILDRVLDSETVLFNLSTNKLHSLNITASFIWQHCTGANTVKGLGEILGQTFAVTVEQAQADLLPVLASMDRAGIIEL